jgi:L-threonylcarbamoyladenylate synthase
VVVGWRHPAVPAALAGDGVVAVPGPGGYLLADRRDRPSALGAMHDLAAGRPDGPEVTVTLAVGTTGQAMALTSVWSEETRRLVNRIWPGPLTVIVPDRDEAEDGAVRLTMPAARPLRRWCRDHGPLALTELRRPGGQPVRSVADVLSLPGGARLTLVVDGGPCEGPGPTVVDCRVSPPRVAQVGAVPEAHLDAALLMGSLRRRWARATRPPRSDQP